MDVYTVAKEEESPVAAHRLFKALVLQRHQVLVKAQPHVFKSGEIIQGDGGFGTVTKITFVEGHPFKYMLHRFDELDTANFYCKYTLFEGDVLRDNMHKVVNEEEIKIGQEKAHGLYKQVEEYLTANPDVFA